MSLRNDWIGRQVHLWGFVVDSKGRASMSQYIIINADGSSAEETVRHTLPATHKSTLHTTLELVLPLRKGMATQDNDEATDAASLMSG